MDRLAIPLAGAVACWSLAALFTHGVMTLFSYASELKRYTAKQLLVSMATGAAGTLGAVGRVATRLTLWLTLWWLTILAIFIFFSTLYVTYTEFPETWIGAVRGYNLFFGPYLHMVVLAPFRILDLFLRALLPVWNGFFWFVKAMAVQGLLPIALDQMQIVVDMGLALYRLLLHLTAEVSRFVLSFACTGRACLQPERGVRDLLTSMADVREIAIHTTRIARAFCGTVAAPLDLMLYPLMDLSFAEGVHNLANAAVQLLVVTPWFTTLRCKEASQDPALAQYRTLLCTPDLAPTFNFLVAGVSSLGLAIDNWLNVALLIVETVIGGDPPACQTDEHTGIIPDLLATDPLFQNRPTVLVGLSDWLYAVTDGQTAVYTGHSAQEARMHSWPAQIDPLLGVAAVTYSRIHDLDVSTFSPGRTSRTMQTTAMLGCECQDTQEGLSIACAILPMAGIPSEDTDLYRMRVLFSDPLAPTLYTCAGVDIYVRSVRWSYTRYEAVTQETRTIPINDCISRGTCREVDATVWLIPRCGQDSNLNRETACISTAPCVPFCMAARGAGSGPVNLVFNRANAWRDGATILGQDCALDGSSPDTIQLGMPSPDQASSSRTNSYLRSLLQVGPVEVYGFTNRAVCSRAPGVTSVVRRNQTRVAYNVQLTGQPFVITGDTVLTTISLGGGVESVQVRKKFLLARKIETFFFSSRPPSIPSRNLVNIHFIQYIQYIQFIHLGYSQYILGEERGRTRGKDRRERMFEITRFHFFLF